MSCRYWSTALERKEANNLLLFAADGLSMSTSSNDSMSTFSSSSSSSTSLLSSSSSSSTSSLSSSSSSMSLLSSDEMSLSDDSSYDDDDDDFIFDLVLDLVVPILEPVKDKLIIWNQMVVVADFTESQCQSLFWFRKTNLQLMADLLWPKLSTFLNGNAKIHIIVGNCYVMHYKTMLLMFLFRLSRPVRICPDMERQFGLQMTHISAALAAILEAFYGVSLPYLSNPGIWYPLMPTYANAIQAKTLLLDCLWCFIDGTLQKTTRPVRFQRHNYSGHKRHHGIKFQIVVAPDGFITCLDGPKPGSFHDSHMLAESGLIDKLKVFMPLEGPNRRFSLYGDPAYPQTQYLFGGFCGANPNSPKAAWSTVMSKSQIVVEWAFAEILANWPYLDFTREMKVFKFPCGKYYIIAAFLTNICNSFVGCKTSKYFDCPPLSFEQYLALVIDEPVVND